MAERKVKLFLEAGINNMQKNIDNFICDYRYKRKLVNVSLSEQHCVYAAAVIYEEEEDG